MFDELSESLVLPELKALNETETINHTLSLLQRSCKTGFSVRSLAKTIKTFCLQWSICTHEDPSYTPPDNTKRLGLRSWHIIKLNAMTIFEMLYWSLTDSFNAITWTKQYSEVRTKLGAGSEKIGVKSIWVALFGEQYMTQIVIFISLRLGTKKSDKNFSPTLCTKYSWTQ